MINSGLGILLLMLASNLFSQDVQQFNFNVHRYNDSVKLESCIPLEYYSERLMLPNRQQTNPRQIYDFIPIYIIGNIKEITTLREDQIIIIE
jgi:hypothetical protein